jgi:hypothetical protein
VIASGAAGNATIPELPKTGGKQAMITAFTLK